jgi:hypothetical protein
MKNFMIVLTLLATLSCSKVNFSSQQSSDDPTPPVSTTSTTGYVPQGTDIKCDVYLNNHLQSLQITLPGTNPTVTATCTPGAITYTWSVTKDNAVVAVNGLVGATSSPDLTSLGAGTYRIVLTGTATNYGTYTNSSSPLLVTITNGTTPPVQTVSCSPRLNGGMTAVTLTPGAGNPTVAANCNPADASCQWTVSVGGGTVMIPGLSGCSATPDFSAQNPGVYSISLTATKSGYNTYLTSSPMTVTIPPKTAKNVTTTKTVTAQDNQLDVTLVIDDSNSMLADNQKLAARLQNFVNDLTAAGFDWQMCATVTRAQQLTANDPNLYWGASRFWIGVGGTTPWILKKGTANVNKIFADTIQDIGAGWLGSDDERGIKAAWWHLWNGDVNYADPSGCYRREAGLATIIISDEDERSIGGDWSQYYYPGEYKDLEEDDLPIHYYGLIREVFGPQKRFSVNSIIVRPGDNACMAAQDAAGSKSHYGYKYNELALMAGGSSGSICDADYAVNLKTFKDRIVQEMGSLPLECAPVDGKVTVTLTPNMNVTTRVEGSTLYFTPKIPAGTTIKADYQCPL